ncbi:zinc finger protein 43-like [Bradysia coprophila]|uniref:zinc finger protein 43-like n=1 Tax=Bradysia coprophila TaxID=38358 RepID=UPI00187DBC71|nr:zinc finger protein 43-like [Bradysia coprophila]
MIFAHQQQYMERIPDLTGVIPVQVLDELDYLQENNSAIIASSTSYADILNDLMELDENTLNLPISQPDSIEETDLLDGWDSLALPVSSLNVASPVSPLSLAAQIDADWNILEYTNCDAIASSNISWNFGGDVMLAQQSLVPQVNENWNVFDCTKTDYDQGGLQTEQMGQCELIRKVGENLIDLESEKWDPNTSINNMSRNFGGDAMKSKSESIPQIDNSKDLGYADCDLYTPSNSILQNSGVDIVRRQSDGLTEPPQQFIVVCSRADDTPTMQYDCDLCTKSFRLKWNFEKHTKNHIGEKKFIIETAAALRRHVCNICQKSFGRKKSLDEHLNVHTGTKPYECKICKMKFHRKGSINEHLKSHYADATRYKCDVCNQTFSRKWNLKEHSRLHSDEKPYKCTVCEKSFRLRRCLSVHSKIHSCFLQNNIMIWTHNEQYSIPDLPGEIPVHVLDELHRHQENNSAIIVPPSSVEDILNDLMQLDEEILDSLALQVAADLDALDYTSYEWNALSNENVEVSLNLNENERKSEESQQIELTESMQQIEDPATANENTGITTEPNNLSVDSDPEEANVSNLPTDSWEMVEQIHQVYSNDSLDTSRKEIAESSADFKPVESSDYDSVLRGPSAKCKERTVRYQKTFVQTEGKREHECKLCTKVFRSRCDLSGHLLNHNRKRKRLAHLTGPESNKDDTKTPRMKKRHECSVCKKTFRWRSNLLDHLVYHSGARPYECQICNKTFPWKKSFAYHKAHCGVKKFVCRVCNESFKLQHELHNHSKIHSVGVDIKPYRCEVCSKSFWWQSHLDYHLKSHSDAKPYECALCKKSYRYADCLKSHLQVHCVNASTRQPHECEICKKKFLWKKSFMQHMTLHSDPSSYRCEICNQIFKLKSSLDLHLRTHSGPLECEICKIRFLSRCALERHLMVHSDVKPYECDVCKKCFKYKSVLKRHSVVHSDVRPYECGVCNRTFKLKMCLQSHAKCHSDLKPIVSCATSHFRAEVIQRFTESSTQLSNV